MSFDTEIVKTELSGLPELYDFSMPDGSTGRYTSFQTRVVYKGNTYAPVPVRRGDIVTDASLDIKTVSITGPVLEAFALYVGSQPLQPVQVTITRVVYGSTENSVLLFSGRIRSVSLKDRVMEAVCESGSRALRALIPRVIFQSACNHALFSQGCGLDASAFSVPASVIVAGALVRSTVFSIYPSGYFAGGRLSVGSMVTMITWHSGGDLKIHMPVQGLVSGSDVVIYPGCDGSPSVCKNRFNNFGRFLGFTCIPNSNPVIWGL